MRRADLVVVAVPMDAMVAVLPPVLDVVTAPQVVIDVGSTKQALLAAVAGHPQPGPVRGRAPHGRHRAFGPRGRRKRPV